MGILDLFSKRQKRLRGEVPEVYQYTQIPQPLRVQLIHIFDDAFGRDEDRYDNTVYAAFESVHDSLAREYGVFALDDESITQYGYDKRIAVRNFLLKCEDTDRVLDAVEVSMRVLYPLSDEWDYRRRAKPKITHAEAVDEINSRFKEHGVGFQIEGGEVVRVDSTYLHSEAVKPVLLVLSDKRFAGANEEFLRAHEHYRHGRYKECLNDCLKAFESTMKTVCSKRGWAYDPKDTAKRLIEICFQNGLVPSYLQAQFASLRSSLESGIPTVRNKEGGHGQGGKVVAVPQYLAGYLLHLTATTILFLVEAERNLP